MVRDVLEKLDPPTVVPDTPVDPTALRAARVGALRKLQLPQRPVAKVEDRTVPGPEGPIPVRVYWSDRDGPHPILVYFHGGGWVLGNLDTVDDTCRALAMAARCAVVSVDYRLAPEHKFPSALEDAYAATRWASDFAPELGGDPQRLAVAGDSAGGNLAAVVALLARDLGGPRITAQVLVYPIVEHNFDTPSYRENGQGYFLTRTRWSGFGGST